MKQQTSVLVLSLMLTIGCQSAVASVIEREEILPLTKSQWGQQAPFFYNTPTTNEDHCKTGCVATAMSQLIYYHQYPQKGKVGTYSYMTGAHGNISFNFAEHTFDYKLMKAVYDRTETSEDASAKEVSKLMFATGVTVNMDYGLTSSAGQFGSVSNSFREWFLYPEDGIKQVSREYFTHEEWSNLIYDELAHKRPVIYMGGNGSSSHVFICDGYKDGEFHMNWGWYGECDGYFSLIDLQTYVPSQGKVWSLNSSQSIVRGIHAPGTEVPTPLSTAQNFDYSEGSFILASATISATNKNVVLGVKAIDSEGNEQLIWADGETELKRSSNTVSFNLNLSALTDGDYTFRPLFKLPDDDTNTIYNVYCNLNNNRYLTVKVENNDVVSAKGGTDAEVNVSISEFKPTSPFIYGEVLNRSFTVFAENTGNVNITRIKQWFYKPGTDTRVEANENSYTVSLSSGTAQTITLALPSNLQPGQYEMQLLDPNNNLLGSRIPITNYDKADAITIGDSPFRFLALDTPMQALALNSDGNGEAIMFKPSS
ncbi:MAG: C10 family peptidase, partial [Muribaculaceae bacterium]|nr:C10 family peptidase [Muribaculaceae bacterium]